MAGHKFDHSIIEVETFDLFTDEERKRAGKRVKMLIQIEKDRKLGIELPMRYYEREYDD